MKLLPFLLAICMPTLLLAQAPGAGEKLSSVYARTRTEAIKQVNTRYVQQADAVMKLSMQAGDLEKATATSDWIKRLQDNDEANDTDGIAPNAGSPDRLVALQTRYLQERADAVTRVNKLYALQVEGAQRSAMQRGDLALATELNELKTKIQSELGTSAAPTGGGEPLFSLEKQKKWKPKKGKWEWQGTKLVGDGDGSIQLDISLQPPFVAVFKYNPAKGIRAGLIFDGPGIQNAAYADKLGIPGVKDEEYMPYKHGTAYRCVFVVGKKQCDLYVDGKHICTGAGKDKKVEKITIYSGDGWSPGSVEVQDLVILRGTDKVPAQ